MGLLKGRSYYKPFQYEQFYNKWKVHERSHWLPAEVPMHDDVHDWNNRLDDNQKKFLTNIFRFFTQGDVDVAGAYCSEYLPNFCETPEIAMFMCSVAAREAVHIDAYSHLIETLGMPESTYREFLEYHEMKEKQDYIKKFQHGNYGSLKDDSFMTKLGVCISMLVLVVLFALGVDVLVWFSSLLPAVMLASSHIHRYRQRLIKEHIAAGIALFSGFTEGMQLFSSFTMLLSFPMNGLMKGMGQIVSWSIVDETQHTDGMITLFKIFVDENTECRCNPILGCNCIRPDVLRDTVKKIALEMVRLEDEFINLAYDEYADDEVFMNISKTKLKQYIRFIANKRMEAMRYDHPFPEASDNPLPEFEIMINAPINTNFFENRSTDYARTNNDWSTVWGHKQ
ncbi:hypothetical protein AV955_gp066 [Diadromus pulchellus ascovirus 4a]|uniref:ribonucleoside-diphosphate reductase n=1 Tax=Diadromus pulchellus ascovirus 4a TaxID=158683 RepID=F2NYZ5_9VIRU|nr:hypothetical protein AV955_gp066 [Diadromus pulchellus ascovirus 4a]CCA61423.1 unnamed protein product [Diadromus pulchellus ascovirus 4a]